MSAAGRASELRPSALRDWSEVALELVPTGGNGGARLSWLPEATGGFAPGNRMAQVALLVTLAVR
eukprot:1358953-Heterocapsa_arctica.AAC.1